MYIRVRVCVCHQNQLQQSGGGCVGCSSGGGGSGVVLPHNHNNTTVRTEYVFIIYVSCISTHAAQLFSPSRLFRAFVCSSPIYIYTKYFLLSLCAALPRRVDDRIYRLGANGSSTRRHLGGADRTIYIYLYISTYMYIYIRVYIRNITYRSIGAAARPATAVLCVSRGSSEGRGPSVQLASSSSIANA